MSLEKPDLYNVAYPLARLKLNRKYDREVHGAENIPDVPSLFLPNHIQFADSPLVAISYSEITGRPLRFGAKMEYFQAKGIDDKGHWGRSMKFLMESTRMIPVDRDGVNIRSFQELQATVADRISHGDSVALHPEGTRSLNGMLNKFKAGAGRIALNLLSEGLEIPTVPVGVVYATYSHGSKIHADIIFGEPVMPEEYVQPPYLGLANARRAELLTQVLEGRVAELTGMTQSGIVAPLKRKLYDLGELKAGE